MYSKKLLFIATLILLALISSIVNINAKPVIEVTIIATIDHKVFDSTIVDKLGGKIIYTAELAPVIIVKLPSHTIEEFRKAHGVKHVSVDGVIYALAPPPGRGRRPKEQPPQVIPWGIDRINATEAWSISTGWVDVNGDGDSEIEVAVIDTGVDSDHPDLDKNIKWCVTVRFGRLFYGKCKDRNGHGTHVTGTIAAEDNEIGVVGVAPDVEIYAIKALTDAGYGTWSDLIIAIDLAVKGPDGEVDADEDGVIVGDPDDDATEVISMSLGGESPPEELYEIIVAAYKYNVTLVAAAGNEGAETPTFPAAYPEVIAVGAIDSEDQVPDWSNRNPELTAPGVDVLSTYPDDTYETLDGTSMAAPHVSGVVALIQAARLANEMPVLPPGSLEDTESNTVRGILHITADDLGIKGYDELYGYGVVRADLAVYKAIE